MLLTLADARRDPNPEVRHSARAALARLGERQALHWFRQTLVSDSSIESRIFTDLEDARRWLAEGRGEDHTQPATA